MTLFKSVKNYIINTAKFTIHYESELVLTRNRGITEDSSFNARLFFFANYTQHNEQEVH